MKLPLILKWKMQNLNLDIEFFESLNMSEDQLKQLNHFVKDLKRTRKQLRKLTAYPWYWNLFTKAKGNRDYVSL